MNIFNKISAAILLILNCILVPESAIAGIIEKEPYSIPKKIRYKDNFKIAILPFTGEISEERKYIRDLVRNYLKDQILLYKKVRFPYLIIDQKISAFESSGKNTDGTEKPVNDDKEAKDAFLDLHIADENKIKIPSDINSSDWAAIPGIDILITGTVIQNADILKVRVQVYNNIYARVYSIEKKGQFKEIDQLLEYLSRESIKAIIMRYGYLNISSNEKDAAIYIDGRYFGRTDKNNILLEYGSHKVSLLKNNYAEKTTIINIDEKAAESLYVEFGHEDSISKSIVRITTEPDRARVYLDSDFIGLSPLEKNDVPDGRYRMRIDKEGYITKYMTIDVKSDKENKKDVFAALEKGDSKEYYFSRTSAYNNLFICSSFGIVISAVSYLYFGLKVNDQNAKLDDLTVTDPDYTSKKSRIEDRKDKYKLYQQISLYTAGAMILSAGIFYYLDKAQDDVAIAFYLPQKNVFANDSFTAAPFMLSSIDRGIGIIVTKSF